MTKKLENEKFIEYSTDQFNKHFGNVRKLVEFQGDDVKLLKEKSISLEELCKTVRTECFKSIREIEEYMNRKHENLLKQFK